MSSAPVNGANGCNPPDPQLIGDLTKQCSAGAAEAAKKIASSMKPELGMTVRQFCEYISEFTTILVRGYRKTTNNPNPRDPNAREEIITYVGTKDKLLRETVWNALSNCCIIKGTVIPTYDHGTYPNKISMEVMVD